MYIQYGEKSISERAILWRYGLKLRNKKQETGNKKSKNTFSSDDNFKYNLRRWNVILSYLFSLDENDLNILQNVGLLLFSN